jgi:hypothetical protein
LLLLLCNITRQLPLPLLLLLLFCNIMRKLHLQPLPLLLLLLLLVRYHLQQLLQLSRINWGIQRNGTVPVMSVALLLLLRVIIS